VRRRCRGPRGHRCPDRRRSRVLLRRRRLPSRARLHRRRASTADAAASFACARAAALARVDPALHEPRGEQLGARVVTHAPLGLGEGGGGARIERGSAVRDVRGLARARAAALEDPSARRVAFRSRAVGRRRDRAVARGDAGVSSPTLARFGRHAHARARVALARRSSLRVGALPRREEGHVARARGRAAVLPARAIVRGVDALDLRDPRRVPRAVLQRRPVRARDEEHEVDRAARVAAFATALRVDVLGREPPARSWCLGAARGASVRAGRLRALEREVDRELGRQERERGWQTPHPERERGVKRERGPDSEPARSPRRRCDGHRRERSKRRRVWPSGADVHAASVEASVGGRPQPRFFLAFLVVVPRGSSGSAGFAGSSSSTGQRSARGIGTMPCFFTQKRNARLKRKKPIAA